MLRTENAERIKRRRQKTKTVVFTISWFVLLAAALLLIAFAGHI